LQIKKGEVLGMNVINIDKQVNAAVKSLPDENYMLGRTLMQPFKPANSGSRALMNSVHVEHLMVLTNGEVPLIQTGYETKYGECSTSYITVEDDYKVLHKIPKFTFNNNCFSFAKLVMSVVPIRKRVIMMMGFIISWAKAENVDL